MKKTIFSLLMLAASVMMLAQEYPAGALPGLFSVSAERQVYFSQGNLMFYTPSAMLTEWAFASTQYAPYLSTASYEAPYKIDLFGWGTSGEEGKNPWMTDDDDTKYLRGHNLYEKEWIGESSYYTDYYEYDWGSNRIKNGGDEEKLWRTPSIYEWLYLIERRTSDNKPLAARATVVGVKGLVILPDNFVKPSGAFALVDDHGSWTANDYAGAAWMAMEEAGAAFLPCAGQRGETILDGAGSQGAYWSSTADATMAQQLFFDEDELTNYAEVVHYGCAVRLIQDIRHNVRIENIYGVADPSRFITDAEGFPIRFTKTSDATETAGAVLSKDIATLTTFFLPAATTAAPEGQKFAGWKVKIGSAEPVDYVAANGITVTTENIVVTAAYEDSQEGLHDAINVEKAQKRFENGQLLIEKNGKTYNALGAEMK